MGLGRFIGGLAKAAVQTALLPVDILRDAATAAPLFEYEDGDCNTRKRLKSLGKTLNELPDKIEE